MGRVKVLFAFGTRPEAVKLAPVILAMRGDRRFRPVVCVTGQHREMVRQVLPLFRIRPRHDLGVMEERQTLAGSMAATLVRLDRVVGEERPGLVVVQGDTTSALAGSLAAYFHRVPVAHVEAGLRTGDKYRPYPEEGYRAMAGRIADLHLAPTAGARANLLAEGIPPDRIAVTGNTVVDALFLARARLQGSPGKERAFRKRFPFAAAGGPLLLVTGHRRENLGEGFQAVFGAVRRVAAAHPSVEVAFPVHPNPAVAATARRVLSGLPNVHLLGPLPYEPFVWLMARASAILTDSGGIQEEAPSLGVPVLVTRETTERPEALRAGTALLVGIDGDAIAEALGRILSSPPRRGRGGAVRNPFGDGKAAGRVLRAVAERFLPPGPGRT